MSRRVRDSLVCEGVRANLLAEVTPSEAAIVDAAGGVRAKEKGWTRGLSGAMRSPVRESLVREGVRANLLAG